VQTTLLGLAIAIILALVAALVGPLLIDWGRHRSLFEVEASRLIGVDVRVNGPIEARLLPTPSLTLHDIEIGSGEEAIHARQLGFEFALGALMRGQWQASDLHLVGPQLSLGFDASGRLRLPKLAVSFSPDNLSIDRLSIEDGTVNLNDAANGARATLKGVWFNGEARSLLGPFNGEGAATVAGELYPFRVAGGRYGDDGALKLKINVDPVSRPLSIAAEGMLSLAGGAPTFDGSLNLTRPVAIAARGGQAGGTLSQPWHLSGKLKVSAAKALMQQFEFQYGSDEQGLKLTGVADFKFGAHPRFDGVLSGRQIDLDQALAGQNGRPPPAAAIRKIAQLAGGAFRPAIPIQIGIGIDQVTLGGNTVANVRGDISTEGGGWNLDRFEFRAPGFTQVKLSGRLAVAGDGVSFTGPAEIEAGDPKQLTAWLEGRAAATQGDLQPLMLRGDITFGSDRLAIERLQATFDRKTVTGRFVYRFASYGQAATLDAVLNAPELDVGAALAFGKALVAGSQIERPRNMRIAADIGRARVAGFVARDASARVKVDGNGVEIDRLAVADLGGGSFSASGRIDTSGHAPRGSLALDFESGQTAAIAALVDQFAPNTPKPVGGLFERVQHAKLHATLDVGDDKQASLTMAQAAVTGALDAMNVDLHARLSGDWQTPGAADVRLDSTVDTPDGAALLKLIGINRYVAAGKGAGQFKLTLAGPADREQTIDVQLSAEGLAAQGHGRVSFAKGLHLNASLDVAKADLRPLRAAGLADSGGPLPFSLNSQLSVADRALRIDDFNARLGGTSVRGNLAIDGQKISGTLDADTIEAAPLIAAAIGMPAPPVNGGTPWSWSGEPFTGGVFGDYRGDIALKVRQVGLLSYLSAREFRATLRFDQNGFSVDDIACAVGGGKLAGALTFHSSANGLKTQAKLSLAGIDAASVLPAAARPPVSGALDLSATVDGAGLSPVALIGSLQGEGKIALRDGQFAGLDPRAFDAVTRAVDQGVPIDAARISDVVSRALDSGQLAVRRAEATLAVSAGQVRLNNASAESKDAALSLAGNLDLTDGSLDARLVLSGVYEAAGARPDIFMALKGPLTAPARSIDVSALTGWLTLRAVDHQARQLREIENAQRQASPPRQKKLAPALPAPLDIRPAPQPKRSGEPQASAVGAQN